MDEILNKLIAYRDTNVRSGDDFSHKNDVLLFFEKINDLKDIIDFEAKNLKSVFDEILCKEFLDWDGEMFTKVMQLGSKVPYKNFWACASNYLLMNFADIYD